MYFVHCGICQSFVYVFQHHLSKFVQSKELFKKFILAKIWLCNFKRENHALWLFSSIPQDVFMCWWHGVWSNLVSWRNLHSFSERVNILTISAWCQELKEYIIQVALEDWNSMTLFSSSSSHDKTRQWVFQTHDVYKAFIPSSRWHFNYELLVPLCLGRPIESGILKRIKGVPCGGTNGRGLA